MNGVPAPLCYHFALEIPRRCLIGRHAPRDCAGCLRYTDGSHGAPRDRLDQWVEVHRTTPCQS